MFINSLFLFQQLILLLPNVVRPEIIISRQLPLIVLRYSCHIVYRFRGFIKSNKDREIPESVATGSLPPSLIAVCDY
jgi:hypothetical protein